MIQRRIMLMLETEINHSARWVAYTDG